MAEELLFWKKGHVDSFFQALKDKLKEQLLKENTDYIFNVSEDEYCNHLVSEYSIEVPEILQYYLIDPNEGGHSHERGTTWTLVIELTDDGSLFNFKTSTWTSTPPRGELHGTMIYKYYSTYNNDSETSERLTNKIKNDIRNLEEYIGFMKGNVKNYNTELERYVRELVRQRKEKLLKEREAVASLGVPIKRRGEVPKTYSVPTERKKPVIERPKVDTTKPLEPDPAISEQLYEEILSIAQNMTQVMECSPHSFATMKEEDIRQHFLVQLNAQYKGEGLAEAFNYEGKTDILMRHKGKNVFIAECKFWNGPKSLADTIDQLLSYTSWRDTKTAIFLFNRRKNFSAVLEKIPGIIREHPCYKQDIESKEETVFKYRFHHRDDVNRELWLTVMAFDVPKEEQDD